MPAVFALVLLAQWPLVANPGWFSHDELQWAAAARPLDGGPPHWVGWLDVGALQYRPLTFNLWLLLARSLGDSPMAFHGVVVAMGALNAALLAALLQRLQLSPLRAALAAAAFALGPYAMYVHGWVGTLGDLLWVAMALGIGWLSTAACPRPVPIATASGVLVLVALLAKESALSIPALLAVAAVLDRSRAAWRWALAGAAVPALAYLLLRGGALMGAADADPAYAWSVANGPVRWLEYHAYWPQPSVFEVSATLLRGFTETRVLVALALWAGLVAALARVGWRWPVALLAGSVAALGPVLVLATAYNQYGYALSALVPALVALAWVQLPRVGRVIATVLALLSLWHGVNVMHQVREVGEVQAVFTPALVEALATHGGGAPLRLQLSGDAERTRWVFQRLVHDVPHVGGVVVGGRVVLLAPGETADIQVEADGRLTPIR